MNIEKYNKLHNELMKRLENGEITTEQAKEVNDLSFDKYIMEEATDGTSIYVLDDKNVVLHLRRLLQLNADCVFLKWNKFFNIKSNNILNALTTIEYYIKDTMSVYCNDDTKFASFTDDEEIIMLSVLKKSDILKNTLGKGVILTSEKNIVLMELRKYPELTKLVDALNTNKNVIIF